MKPAALALSALLLLAACGGGGDDGPDGGYATGKVTFEDGSAITGDVRDYQISIQGVSEAGERVGYSPAVQDGRYRQKLAPGQYTFSTSRIKVAFGGNVYALELVPVGPNWNKDRDAADGIVQDFVWKPTGQRETYGATPDPNNHTHWHGLSIGLQFLTWREDTKSASVVLPAGSTLVFTLTPTSRSIDGRELQPIVVERAFRPADVTPIDDLNDLPVASYDMTAVARLPDGSTKPVLLQGKGNYPGFVPTGKVTVEYDNIIGGLWKQPFGWVTD